MLVNNAKILGLVLISLYGCKGLNFTLDTRAADPYCGQLVCTASFPPLDPGIVTIISLSISEVLPVNRVRKLVSASIFEPDLDFSPDDYDVVNVTGSVTRFEAELQVWLKNESFCTSGSFMCELDFVNLTGQSQKEQATVAAIDEATWKKNVEQHLATLEEKLTALSQQVVDTNSKLDSILHQLPRPGDGNVSVPSLRQNECIRGIVALRPRQPLILWNQTQTLCDGVTDSGGWVVIQRRTKGDVDFYRDWNSYKNGFGTPDTDYWIGNDVIHNLTSQGYTEMRIDLILDEVPNFVQISEFRVADEKNNYQLTVTNDRESFGTIGDVITYHNHANFSTFDRDYDSTDSYDCAERDHAGWWFNNCATANLNGPWGQRNGTGLSVHVEGGYRFPTFVEMKLRNPQL